MLTDCRCTSMVINCKVPKKSHHLDPTEIKSFHVLPPGQCHCSRLCHRNAQTSHDSSALYQYTITSSSDAYLIISLEYLISKTLTLNKRSLNISRVIFPMGRTPLKNRHPRGFLSGSLSTCYLVPLQILCPNGRIMKLM